MFIEAFNNYEVTGDLTALMKKDVIDIVNMFDKQTI